MRRGSALTKYEYDTLGRVDEERRYSGKEVHEYVATKYTYDLLDRIAEECEVDANGTIYTKKKTTYDENNNITETKTWNHSGTAVAKNTYDPRGNLSSSTDPLGNTTHYNTRYDFFLDGLNLPCLEITDPTGVKTISVSDHQGSIISVQIYSPVGTLLSDTEMFYDIRGNIVRKEQYLP
ncbi:MAG: hypothetical protein H0T62_12615, partial [Parachlamydiaceae bacterium]|nr:hypothetical protein [Parachlamydiaceae bacterium]